MCSYRDCGYQVADCEPIHATDRLAEQVERVVDALERIERLLARPPLPTIVHGYDAQPPRATAGRVVP